MNKRQWFASTDPRAMLRFLSGRTSDRKMRLFAVACCRRFWSQLSEDECCRNAVETAERFADRTATVRACRIARATVEVPWGPESDFRLRRLRELARAATRLSAYGAADESAREAIILAGEPAPALQPLARATYTDREAQRHEQSRQVSSVRCIFGNPFRPTSVEPAWLTSNVLALAQGTYAERAFERLPILADALQDAGCTNEDLLKHLRHDAEHARGCWALDLVLGLS